MTDEDREALVRAAELEGVQNRHMAACARVVLAHAAAVDEQARRLAALEAALGEPAAGPAEPTAKR